MSFLSQLDIRFNSEIVRIQLAVDNCWEKAWVLNGHKKPDNNEIDLYSSSGFNEIACEAFFNDPSGEQLFLGISYQPQNNAASESRQWITRLLEVFTTQNSGILNTIGHLSGALDDMRLFQSTPARIEVGVTDFWDSCGAELLWDKDKPERISKSTVLRQLSDKPDLYATPLNYQSVEFSFEGAYPHWIGIQVGEKRDGIYKIDVDKLVDLTVELLSLFPGFTFTEI